MDRKKPEPQEFYRHFKDKLYQIIAVAKHSETGEELVIYQALYGRYEIFARPLSMFMSEVDHSKYPEVAQKYRFEKVFPGEEENERTVSRQYADRGSGLQPEKAPEDNEDTGAEGERPNPDLLEFLDADTMEQKRRILIGMKARITDRLIDDLAASLDVTIEQGELDDRYKDLLTCVDTMERFEVNRLR